MSDGEVRGGLLPTPASRGQHIKVLGLRGLCVCVWVCVFVCFIPVCESSAKNRATSTYKMCNVRKCSKTLGATKRERLLQWHHLAYTIHVLCDCRAHTYTQSNKHTRLCHITMARTDHSARTHAMARIRTPAGQLPAPVRSCDVCVCLYLYTDLFIVHVCEVVSIWIGVCVWVMTSDFLWNQIIITRSWHVTTPGLDYWFQAVLNWVI